VRRNLKDKVEFVEVPKFDGLSGELVYEEGAFKYGATRGNGEEGEEPFANPRSAAVGTMRPGDEVRIERAGDVIPEVVGRIDKPAKNAPRPFPCRVNVPCAAPKSSEKAPNYLCSAGLSCKAQLVGRIIHYAARDAMDTEGLGAETAKALVDHGLVKDMADLYCLSAGGIQQLEGFAEKSSKNLHRAILDKKKPHLDRFLYALGIRHVGQRMARIQAVEYLTLDALRKVGRKDLEQISEIGPEIAESVSDFFEQEENRKVRDRLAEAGVEIQDMPESAKRSELANKSFVFTGILESITRNEAKEKVEMLGGWATSSVSGETDCLVVGKAPGRKLEEAGKQGVEILDEKAFKDLIGE